MHLVVRLLVVKCFVVMRLPLGYDEHGHVMRLLMVLVLRGLDALVTGTPQVEGWRCRVCAVPTP